ncbi:hypothetical protein OGAPHI_006850 [Ogataea philodendri]|uniref:Uncharacterized protein n=1 Tax=Ogataea philodendri TaxID=1378263 RepID=A0A9P8T064_9ASCO|nr:uncharacterized protein OGAPHI_006850 [Ogataea philodendri]KAH3661443.1 hypothetical protein OGAPHI_006850 [Ogataea philodendri]
MFAPAPYTPDVGCAASPTKTIRFPTTRFLSHGARSKGKAMDSGMTSRILPMTGSQSLKCSIRRCFPQSPVPLSHLSLEATSGGSLKCAATLNFPGVSLVINMADPFPIQTVTSSGTPGMSFTILSSKTFLYATAPL